MKNIWKDAYRMRKRLTELIFIIDRSSSMRGLEEGTVSGINSMLKEQRAMDGDAVVTTIFFNDYNSIYHDRIDIQGAAPLTWEDYYRHCYPEGNRALVDAIGIAIHNAKKAQRYTMGAYRAEKVLFAIIAGSKECSSSHYTFDMVEESIEFLNLEFGWKFIFFGTNMDAIAEAGKIGIDPDHAHNFSATPAGMQSVYSEISAYFTSHRTGRNIRTIREFVDFFSTKLYPWAVDMACARFGNVLDSMNHSEFCELWRRMEGFAYVRFGDEIGIDHCEFSRIWSDIEELVYEQLKDTNEVLHAKQKADESMAKLREHFNLDS